MIENHQFSALSSKLIENLPGIYVLKDTSSRFIASSPYAAQLAGFSKPSQLAGLYDQDMRCQAAEFSNNFRQQDQTALANDRLQLLEMHCYADGQIHTYLAEKYKVKLEENTHGVFATAMELTSKFWSNIGLLLFSNYHNHYPMLTSHKNSKSFQLVDQMTFDHVKLTTRESECLFLIIRGKSTKMIARILGISPRTVETHLENTKIKFNCKSRSELIDHVFNLGGMSYIPKKLIEKLSSL